MSDEMLILSRSGKDIYEYIRSLPIIDYHCHLDERAIAQNCVIDDIGRLWLETDHYKWRAMRLCGVDEWYITGGADWEEKFMHYVSILPRLVGNPLYCWSHMELKRLCGIDEAVCAANGREIYKEANRALCGVKVRDLLRLFDVRYIATTDDPLSDLEYHGQYDSVTVAPTFRPDRLMDIDSEYIAMLGEKVGVNIDSLDALEHAIIKRLDYFCSRGCLIADHGFERLPAVIACREGARASFSHIENLNEIEREGLQGYLLAILAREYKRRGMLMQLHCAVIRNGNSSMSERYGADSGFDLIGEAQSVQGLVKLCNALGEMPHSVLYTLNDSNLAAIASLTGAFPELHIGAAWWFNDTVSGIRRNLRIVAEYSALGNHYGMLTDSRSFSSYVRFDFFRRVLADYLGELVDKGECDIDTARAVARMVVHDNIKERLRI